MRKQAIYGLLFCFCILGGTLYLDARHGGLICPPCTITVALLATYMLVLMIALIQHPRRWGCKFYALLLLIIASVSLFISIAHSNFQQTAATSLVEECTQSSLIEFKKLPYIDKTFYLLQNKLSCIEPPLMLGFSASSLTTLIALCLFLFSLYLLFRRIDRNIFR